MTIYGMRDDLERIRLCLETGFSEETAYPGTWTKDIPSTGHCAAAAVIVQERLGGDLLSTFIPDEGSHWYNRIQDVDGTIYEVDLTGDQFGEKAVRLTTGFLYGDSRIREFGDVAKETVERAILLADGSAFTATAASLRERLALHADAEDRVRWLPGRPGN